MLAELNSSKELVITMKSTSQSPDEDNTTTTHDERYSKLKGRDLANRKMNKQISTQIREDASKKEQ